MVDDSLEVGARLRLLDGGALDAECLSCFLTGFLLVGGVDLVGSHDLCVLLDNVFCVLEAILH